MFFRSANDGSLIRLISKLIDELHRNGLGSGPGGEQPDPVEVTWLAVRRRYGLPDYSGSRFSQ